MKLREFLSAGLMFFFFFFFLLSGKPVRGAERYIVLRRLGKFGKGRCGVEMSASEKGSWKVGTWAA